MNQPTATIIAGALIAAAIALTNHWSLAADGRLLNRWTGTVFLCGQSPTQDTLLCPLPPHE
jgi:hypothetical protein